MYYKVTIKENDKVKRFWAEKLMSNNLVTLYRRVNNEGDDFGYYNKEGVLVDKQDLIGNDLILKEQAGEIDKKYGTLRVSRGIKEQHEKVNPGNAQFIARSMLDR